MRKIKEKRKKKTIRNLYVIVFVFFSIWMLFFDTNSWLTHRELSKEINKLNAQKKHLIQEIEKDKKTVIKLRKRENLERFAREQYLMKKDNEDIYLIEIDSSALQ